MVFKAMKKIFLLFALCFSIIGGCMVYLMWSGISLRSATLIKPSVVDPGYKKVTEALVYIMFPAMQEMDYAIIGLPENREMGAEVLRSLNEAMTTLLKRPVMASYKTAECGPPCLLMLENQPAHQLEGNPWIDQNMKSAGKKFFTLTIIEFDNYDEAVIPECEKQKRLTFNCLKNLAIKEAQRKMKDPAQQYFFLKKYNHNDYFLFIEKA